jgi:hypothetical protein
MRTCCSTPWFWPRNSGFQLFRRDPRTGSQGSPEEEALFRKRVEEVAGDDVIWFFYGDYDRSGHCEAYAFTGDDINTDDATQADLWYVDMDGVEPMASGLSYYEPSVADADFARVLMAEEGYGGSGSVSHLYSVINGEPEDISPPYEGLEGVTFGGGATLSMYIRANLTATRTETGIHGSDTTCIGTAMRS